MQKGKKCMKTIMKRTLTSLICLVLCGIMLLSASCTGRSLEPLQTVPENRDTVEEQTNRPIMPEGIITPTKELSAEYTRKAWERGQIDLSFRIAMSDFAFDLFHKTLKEAKPGENQNISPLSAVLCLSLIANGAEGETLAQMEAALGMPISDLNHRLYTYAQNIVGSNSDDCTVSLGNSVWFWDSPQLTVKPDYLQTVANWYDAEIFATPFNTQTVNDINDWCGEKTNGKINQVVDDTDMDNDAVMFLINALYFDAVWQDTYEEDQIEPGFFTNQVNSLSRVNMLSSKESVYLSGEGFTGFTKDYKGGQYSFVALLPDQGKDIDTFAASLTGETWRTLWAAKEDALVDVKIPEFTFEYNLSLVDALKAMGMTDMFDRHTADFAAMAKYERFNLYCEEVRQKTLIELDRKGTKAAAVTVGEMAPTAVAPVTPRYSVILNRPFVFAIVDNQTGLPLFLGIVRKL